jgi:catechol 2,3-dioxygenase-like lactoylglutathione lyase family enzyme
MTPVSAAWNCDLQEQRFIAQAPPPILRRHLSSNNEEDMPSTYPRALNHIGLTVPDIFAAIDWYGEVLGFTHVMGPRLLEAEAAATYETPSIFGPRFGRALQAHLLTGNGIGLELFQFIDPPVQRPTENMAWWNVGVFHLCFTDPDIEALAERVAQTGGRQRVPVFEFIPGRPYKLVYCEDPWGNVIELFTHHYAEAFGNWPQPGMTADTTWVRSEDVAQIVEGAKS